MQSDTRSHRVLIVDDAPAVREALMWLLENESDLEVVGEAADGPEALERANELDPDVVILDIELPHMNGYEVTRSLKQMPTPPLVISLSVHGDPLSRKRGVEAGSDGFIEKAPTGRNWSRACDRRWRIDHTMRRLRFHEKRMFNLCWT